MDPSIDAVLVATDGSDPAERAARHGIALAATTDADLHVLSVVDVAASQVTDDVAAGADTALAEEALTDAGEQSVDSVATLAAEADVRAVTTAVRSGTPHREIVAYADEHEIDVIAVGTEGRSGLDRVLLGSVAENVLRTSTRPVLVVPPGAGDPDADRTPYDEILLPTDGSESAGRALEWAVGLADRYDATVHALFAADTTPFPTTVRSQQLLEALNTAGNDAIEGVRQRGDAAGVDVVGAVTSGAPGPTILEYSEDEPVDLVVMGSHGRSGLDRILLGSVTEHVVRNGVVPVLCVPLRDEE